ncbi:hypothetical protein ACOME3_008214 [Neoechinorhynchus agilis]
MYTFPYEMNKGMCFHSEMCPMHYCDNGCYSNLEPSPSIVNTSSYNRRLARTYRSSTLKHRHQQFRPRKEAERRRRCTHCYIISLILTAFIIILLIVLTSINGLRRNGKENPRRIVRESDHWCLDSAVPYPHPFTMNRIISPKESIVVSIEFKSTQNRTISLSSTQPTSFEVFGRNEKCPCKHVNDFYKIFDTVEIGTKFNLGSKGSALVKISFVQLFIRGHWFIVVTNTGNRSSSLEFSVNQNKRISVFSRTNDVPDTTCLNGKLIGEECVCEHGFNGRFCERNDCGDHCGHHGQCEYDPDTKMWSCRCQNGYNGQFCHHMNEIQCQNGVDDDLDGLVDCDDPDCCHHEECSNQEFCTIKSPIILSNTSNMRSLYWRYKRSLIDQYAIQKLTDGESIFVETTTSLLVGNVYREEGIPASGIKVQVMNDPQYGYTYTNNDGFFTMLVNGGKSLVIWFDNPVTQSKIEEFTWVPWSVVHRLKDVVLSPQSSRRDFTDSSIIQFKVDVDRLPFVFRTVNEFFAVDSNNETLRLQIPIGNTDLKLIYTDTMAVSDHFKARVKLTSSDFPAHLSFIHLKVLAAGRTDERVFKARPNFAYDIQWPFKDVMGSILCEPFLFCVSIGFEYRNSADVYWKKKCQTIFPPVVRPSNWTLDSVHHLDVSNGVLHFGSGESINVNRQLAIISSPRIDLNSQLRAIQHAVSLPSGDILLLTLKSLYLIRRANYSKAIKIVNFRINSIERKITLDPVFGYSYIFEPESNTVIRIKHLDDQSDPDNNFESAFDIEKLGRMLDVNFSTGKIRDWVFDNQGTLFLIVDDIFVQLDMKTGQASIIFRFGNMRSARSVFACSPLSAHTIYTGSIVSLTIDRFTNNLFILSDQCIFQVSNGLLLPRYGQCMKYCINLPVEHPRRMRDAVFTETDIFISADMGRKLIKINRFTQLTEAVSDVYKDGVGIMGNGEISEFRHVSLFSEGTILVQGRSDQLFLFFYSQAPIGKLNGSNFQLNIQDHAYVFSPEGVHLSTVSKTQSQNLSLVWNGSVLASEIVVMAGETFSKIKYEGGKTKIIWTDLSNQVSARRSEIHTVLLDGSGNARQLLSDESKYEFEYESGSLHLMRINNATHRRSIRVPIYLLTRTKL